ncbi:MAG: diguanylate cyclase [bacterium]
MNTYRSSDIEMRHTERLSMLRSVALGIVSASDLDTLLSLVVKETRGILGYDNLAVFLVEGEGLSLKAYSQQREGFENLTIPLGQGIIGRCAADKTIISVSDASSCDDYAHEGFTGIQSEIAAPIIVGEHLLGVLTIGSRQKGTFSEEDEGMLAILSVQLGAAIRHLEHIRTRINEMGLLREIGPKMASIFNRDELLSTVIDYTCSTLGYDYAGIYLKTDNKLVLRTHSLSDESLLGKEIGLRDGFMNRHIRSDGATNANSLLPLDIVVTSGLEGIKSAIALPILFEEELLGLLSAESATKSDLGEDDIRLLNILCSHTGVALHNTRVMDEMKRLAVTDGLTGLYNYRYFRERLDEEILRARRYERDLSLILMDLDNFKSVNDLFGHLKGDEVLVMASQLIRKNIRRVDKPSIMKGEDDDITVRYGGEEFMIILPETPLDGAMVVAQRLKDLLKERINRILPVGEQGRECPIITGSFGVVTLKPDETADEFIRRVDEAMYEAKDKGKNTVCSKK